MKIKLETLHAPTATEKPSQKCLIVGIIPFWRGNEGTLTYRLALRRQFECLVKTSPAEYSGVCICSFDAKDILSGTTPIEKLSTVFAQKLDEQRSVIGLTKKMMSYGETSDSPSEMNGPRAEPAPLVFIAHSVGSLVVKCLLSRNEFSSIIFGTRGAIFLDTPSETATDAEAWTRYLNSFQSSVLGRLQKILKGRVKHTITMGGINDTNRRRLVDDSLKEVEASFMETQQNRYIKGEKNHILDSPTITISYVWAWAQSSDTAPGSFENLLAEPTTKRRRSLFPNFKRDSEEKAIVLELANRVDLSSQLGILFESHANQHHDKAFGNPYPSMPVHAAIPEHEQLSDLTQSSLSLSRQQIGPQIISRYPKFGRHNDDKERKESLTDVASTTSGSSLMSHPHLYVEPNLIGPHSEELRSAIALARSFYQRADFKSAESMLAKCRKLCEDADKTVGGYHLVSINAQLAAISLFRGNYLGAETQFSQLLEDLEKLNIGRGSSKDELELDLKRWLSVALLYQRQYDKAEMKLNALAKEIALRGRSTLRVQVLRDLSLANAHLGRYSLAKRHIKEAKAHILERSKRLERISWLNSHEPKEAEEQKRRLITMQDMLCSVESMIETLWGYYERALVCNQKALHGLEKSFGPRHLRTLECASHKSFLLARNSIISEAEKECIRVLDLMKIELGQQHPQTLKTYENLIFILKSQKRLAEAMDTAKSLKYRSKEAFGEKHPQTLSSWLTLAEVQLETGDYFDAVSELRDLVRMSHQIYGRNHMHSLEHSATYARALLHIGSSEEGKLVVLGTFQEQRALSFPSSKDHNAPASAPSASPNDKAVENIHAEALIRGFIDQIVQNSDDPEIHPSILFNLETFALLERDGEEPNWGLVIKILNFVWKQRTKVMNETNALTISARNALAMAFRDGAGTDVELDHAQSHFREIVRLRTQTLGKAHPDVLAAQRELIMINCMLDQGSEYPELLESQDHGEGAESSSAKDAPSNPRTPITHDLDGNAWLFVEGESERIFSMHEIRLGEQHTETLNSHIWLLTVRLILQREKLWEETLKKLLSRLRNPHLCGQRIMQSVLMRRKVASLLARNGNNDRRVDILRGILEDIKSPNDALLNSVLDRVRRTIEEEIRNDACSLDEHWREIQGK